jgi:hypothetical protein
VNEAKQLLAGQIAKKSATYLPEKCCKLKDMTNACLLISKQACL